MAYANWSGKTIKHSWGRFRATAGEQLYCGDLVDYDFYQADATAGENPAKYIACEDIASAAEGWFCLKAEIKKLSTVGAGGAVTRGDHGGTANDLLFLSTTQGTAVEAVDGDGILQVVGEVLSQDHILLDPSPEYWEVMEFEHADKTITATTDSGKCFAIGALTTTVTTGVVVTLPAVASGNKFTIVNVQKDAWAINVSPAAADEMGYPGQAGTDDKDLINTAATARCMDLVVVEYRDASGWFCSELRGTWVGEG